MVGICDRINWDFLLSTLATKLWELTDGFAAKRLASTTPQAFERAFGNYHRLGEDLDCRRRLINLLAIASHVENGGIAERLSQSKRIAGPDGAVALLSALPVYRDDPLLKKGNSLLHQLVRREVILVSDEEMIEPAVDYHVMRLYLRTNRVAVPDTDLASRLVGRVSVPVEVIIQLRRTVAKALRYTAEVAGVPSLVLNEAEWAFARRFCERDAVACFPDAGCPLRGTCPSAGLHPGRMFTEPESRHGYY